MKLEKPVASAKISVGLVGFLPEAQNTLIRHLETAGQTSLNICMEQYPQMEDDHPTQRILQQVPPEVILVDMRDERAAIQALHVLRSVLLDTWLVACADTNHPMLIIEAMQAGAREYLLKPISAESLNVSLERYVEAKKRLSRGPIVSGKIYAVTSSKGGAGATSVAINLAASLAQAKETRVAILDMKSLAGDVAGYMGLESQFNLSDVLDAVPRLDPVLLDTYMTERHGVSVLAASQQLGTNQIPVQDALGRLLRVASQAFTHTIIDMPLSMPRESLRAIANCAEVMLVILTPELPSLWHSYRLIDQLRTMGCGGQIKLILNRDRSNTGIDNRGVLRSLNHPVYFRLPNDYTNSIRAINKGKPLVSMNHSKLASSYKELTQKLAGIDVAKRRRGFLRLPL